MTPTWKALKFRGSTVLAGTYWLVSQSETQITCTVNAPFQAVKKQTTHQKTQIKHEHTHPKKPKVQISVWRNVNKKSWLV